MTAASAAGPATTHPVWRRLGRGVLLALLLVGGCAALAVPAARAAMAPDTGPVLQVRRQDATEEDRARDGPEDTDGPLPSQRHRTAGHGRPAALPLDVRAGQAHRERDLGAAAAAETLHPDGSLLPVVLRQPQHRRRPLVRDFERHPRRPGHRESRVGADHPGAARGRDGCGARHRGRGSRLLRGAGLRLQHARLAAGGAELTGHGPDGRHEDRAGRLLRRCDRHGVGRAAGAHLRAGDQLATSSARRWAACWSTPRTT